MLLHGRRNKRRRVAAVCRNLADSRRGDVCEVLARHHEERLDLGSHAAVRERHLELVLEVAVDPDAADDDLRLFAAAEVDEKAVKHLDLDVFEFRPLHVLANHREAIFRRKASALLGTRRRDCDDEAIVEFRRALYEVEVTERHRVERSRIYCRFLCHAVYYTISRAQHARRLATRISAPASRRRRRRCSRSCSPTRAPRGRRRCP